MLKSPALAPLMPSKRLGRFLAGSTLVVVG